jgi:PAS domain S-box-containing protein
MTDAIDATTSVQAENQELRRRLEEAESLIQAIQGGEVDAFLMKEGVAERVFTLETAQRPYHILLEKMEQGAVVLTGDGRIGYCNECLARMLRAPLNRVSGAAIDSFIPESARSTFEVLLARSRQTSFQGEINLQRTDGSVFPAFLTLNPLLDGTGVSLIVTDLTEQKRQAELLASHELAPLIVEQAVDGIVICDADGKVIRASLTARELSGGNPLLQAFDSEFPIFFAPLLNSGEMPVRAVSARKVLQGKTVKGLEAVFLRTDGTQVPLLVNACPLRNEQQEVLGCIITLTDITERKRNEEMLKNADRRKDEFLALLGHELRNPLAPIRNALEIMRVRPIEDPMLKQVRDILERQTQQLTRLVDDLLDISRIARDKLQLKKSRVALGEVVARAVETSQPLIAARRQHLHVQLPAKPFYLTIDGARMAQVIANLLNNAAKYSEPNSRIDLIGEERPNEFVIRVRDAGIGIKSELLPHVFDLFMQAERHLDRSEGGLGIGLALVRKLVEMHGGKVVASSEGPGKGSEFVITLPVSEEQTGREPQSVAPTRRTLTPLRILVIDDDRDAAESLKLLLRYEGHQVESATDGGEAMVAAQQFRPQAVILDLGMPRMDGFEIAEGLRRLPGMDRAVLIALTGYGSDDDRERCRQASFDFHLTKPVDLPALEAALAQSGVKLTGA